MALSFDAVGNKSIGKSSVKPVLLVGLLCGAAASPTAVLGHRTAAVTGATLFDALVNAANDRSLFESVTSGALLTVI